MTGTALRGSWRCCENDAPGAVKQFELATAPSPIRPICRWPTSRRCFPIKQAPEAEKLGLAVIEKNKNFAPMYDVLYVYYMQNKRAPEAERILQRKVENNPQQGNYLVELAAHYLFTKQNDQVDAVMRRLADEKQFPEGHLLAGDFLYFRARDFERARAQYEAGEKAFPKDKALYQKRLVELLATTGQQPGCQSTAGYHPQENPQ